MAKLLGIVVLACNLLLIFMRIIKVEFIKLNINPIQASIDIKFRFI
ncbi:hypothetical protein CNEO4_620003 [Clostridium neonatale]|uniref:Uncharacterized protein n=1 Tax=Clostridium neonatale TaxID=137838 RepID=A0AA86JMJ9_9CLOT|nr:hypothetical protein CNEO_41319 [Clostridium neonatale]CAI3210852.1 hypothetical protein CNEO2_650023 [Clostridium neonatale]CAI3213390.1 hypothetical protein CNEO2_680023 [Clostridium neonatale]CAI3245475.1 hypothetical protein CNEO2_640023 [Clostridium neonatale]CAI3558436.1 hypothetical protein CNEO4_1160011 [Clostridium neonatale]